MKYILILIFFITQSVAAQNRLTVKGKVSDAAGNQLPGVSIKDKNDSKNGTVSGAQGDFSLQVAPEATLIFSIIGYEDQEVNIKGNAAIEVVMKEAENKLNEVVVIGYGSTTKKEVTSAITSLKPEDFNQGNISNPIGLIQGKVAGLNITRPAGGDVNGGFDIQLRGLTTLSGGQGPLFVIDGVIGGDLNSVNIEEIASIDVLKDGSAAAIYGTRGTNGVIIITTKQAKAGQRSLAFSTYVSTQSVANTLRNLTAAEFRDAISTQFPGREQEFDFGANTDWFKEVTRKPVDQYYDLSLAAGSEHFNYRAALNYRGSQGLVKDNENNRLQAKIAVNQKELNDKLNISYNFLYTQTNREYTDQNVLQQAFRRNPTEPVYDPANLLAGGYYRNTGPFDYYNPVAMLSEEVNSGDQQMFTGSARASYSIFSGLNAIVFGSIQRETYKNSNYFTRFYPIALGNNGVANLGTGTNSNDLMEASLDYKKKFGDHDLQAVAGYSFQQGVHDRFSGSNNNFDTDLYQYNNIGAGAGLPLGQAVLNSYKESNRLIAFFGRVTYNYKEKYLFQASLRREGSSRFGANHKWGNFPAVSAGWRINKEDFMSGASWLSDLKVRAGFGVTGNQDIGNYLSLSLLAVGGKTLYNGQWINTYPPASNPNPDLKWERKEEMNLGLDYAVFNSRLSGSIDYYVRNTNDLLWTYNVPVPPNLYNQLYTNVGKMRNSGLEVTINATPVKNDNFAWNTTLLYSRNKNKLVSFSDAGRGFELTDLKEGWLGTDLATWTHQIVEGGSVGNFVALVFEGIDAEGNSIYKDTNQDGAITDQDRQIVGNAYPKFQMSFSNAFNYKNFDLSFLLRGSYGNKMLNVHRIYYENFGYLGGKNILLSALDYPEFKGKAEYSSRFVEDASFIKLDNVSLGYTLKLKKGFLKQMRIYATGQQLLTITKYKGVDPEVNLSGLAPGFDSFYFYPRTRTYTFGTNITF